MNTNSTITKEQFQNLVATMIHDMGSELQKKKEASLAALLMMETGIRPREALALRRQDFNLDDRTISIRQTKTGTHRMAIMPDYMMSTISGLIQTKRACDPVFTLTEGQFRKYIKNSTRGLLSLYELRGVFLQRYQ